jgi:hypothetical protein
VGGLFRFFENTDADAVIDQASNVWVEDSISVSFAAGITIGGKRCNNYII